MASYADQVRLHLAKGPKSARQLIEKIGISQPTLSRAVLSMGDQIVRIGAARSIQYALRDRQRGLDDIPIYRVDAEGMINHLGVLIPVRADGYIMQKADGVSLHSHGIPWWLYDMRPQGYLGRAYALKHANILGLPANLSNWNDAHMLHALSKHGHDAVGNLLLGDIARDTFLNAPAPEPISMATKGEAYARLAGESSNGDRPGSSAGGEQAKFSAFVETPNGSRHVLVKFTIPDQNSLTERWRDLLLAEHHALETLSEAGVQAAPSRIIDHAGQRFLEVERFDRIGDIGRRGVFSLTAIEAEFVGEASAPWSVITARLARDAHITQESAHGAALLNAFGLLIGNTDMHNGNLTLISDEGRPYRLAPAYDMLPMGYAPKSSGGLSNSLQPVSLHPSINNAVWIRAHRLAANFLARVQGDAHFSAGFQVCINDLAEHIRGAHSKISRLG